MLRRTFLHSAAGLTGLAATVSPAMALVEININKGNVEPLPIAVTDFIAGGDLGQKITDVIAADLKRSGLFAPDRQAGLHREDLQSRRSRRASRTGRSSTRRRW